MVGGGARQQPWSPLSRSEGEILPIIRPGPGAEASIQVS